MKCTSSWYEEWPYNQVNWDEVDAHEAADPFGHLYTAPPPDTEWTQDDIDRLGDAPDMTLGGW